MIAEWQTGKQEWNTGSQRQKEEAMTWERVGEQETDTDSDNWMRKCCWWAHGCGWLAVFPSASQNWQAEESIVDDEAVDKALHRGTPQDEW